MRKLGKGVDNMKILNSLTIKNLKLNRKRTITTIIGISLSVALICAITTFVASVQTTLIERAKKLEGNYHLLFQNVPPEKISYLENFMGVEEKQLSQAIGYASFTTTNENKPYVYVINFSKEALQVRGIVLTRWSYA